MVVGVRLSDVLGGGGFISHLPSLFALLPPGQSIIVQPKNSHNIHKQTTSANSMHFLGYQDISAIQIALDELPTDGKPSANSDKELRHTRASD